MAMRLQAFRAASTFDGVANLYQSLKPWEPGNEYGTQKGETKRIENCEKAFSISPHMKRYVTLRPVTHGYAARYHDTDVVTWTRRRDEQGRNHDQVTVEGYSSLSTESFADDFTPSNLRFKLALDDGFFVRVAVNSREKSSWYYDDNDTARCYEFDSVITFDVANNWATPVEGTTKTSFIDARSPALGRALRQTKYQDFMNYARARLGLDQGHIPTRDLHAHIGNSTTLDLLDDPNKWDEILFSKTFENDHTRFSHIARIEMVSEYLRTCIYKHFNAVPVREVEWYNWSSFKQQRKLREKYSWAVY